MSRLRTNPNKLTCSTVFGKYEGNRAGERCGELAVIRCNACRDVFCQECWDFHLEMTVVEKRVAALKGEQK